MSTSGLFNVISVCVAFSVVVLVPAYSQPTNDGPTGPGTLRQEVLTLPEPPQEANQAAVIGKKTFEHLIRNNDKHARELGFLSAADAADSNTNVGKAIPTMRVNFQMLRAYNPTTMKPTSLLIPTTEFLYPVTVNGQVRSSVTVSAVRTDPSQSVMWRATEWGNYGLIRALNGARQIAESSEESSFVLEILPLGRYFLGNVQGERFVIIPLRDEIKLGFRKGVPVQADVVFQKLAPEAKAIPVHPIKQPSR